MRPWANAGHKCWCVDIQHEKVRREGNITFLPYNVLDLVDKSGRSLCDWMEWDFVFAWPPCTDLAVSGARWFKEKGLTSLVEALAIVDACRKIAEQSDAPYLLENPVSTISTYWRKPDFKFDPYEFGGYDGGADDGYTKKTCLWVGNGFVMPELKPIELDPKSHDRIHKAAPGPDRANLRSESPKGFVQAIYEANKDTKFHCYLES